MNANSNQTNGTKTSEMLFTEAPASWNTKYIDPNGFECQITLRGETGSELLERAASAIAFLLKNGCQPFNFRNNGTRKPISTSETQEDKSEAEKANDNGNGKNGSNGHNGSNGNAAWCAIHNCEMKRWDKDGRVWYSHKVDGGWCRGK